MLKKQTVWLLAMLSLIVVLSVYYMSSPNSSPSDPLAIPADKQHDQNKDKDKKDTKPSNDQKQNKAENQTQKSSAKDHEQTSQNKQSGTASTQVADEEAFASAKVNMDKSRSKLKHQYTQVVASDKASAKEKSKAKEKIDKLQQVSSKEQMLESLIKAKGYKEALVNAQDDHVVNVIVKANQLSNKQVVEIIDMVKDHLNDPYDVAVSYRPAQD